MYTQINYLSEAAERVVEEVNQIKRLRDSIDTIESWLSAVDLIDTTRPAHTLFDLHPPDMPDSLSVKLTLYEVGSIVLLLKDHLDSHKATVRELVRDEYD